MPHHPIISLLILYYLPTTGKGQAQDIAINGPFKANLRSSCNTAIAKNVAAQLTEHGDTSRIKVGLKLSDLKPQMMDWLSDAHSRIAGDPALVKSGFKKAKVCARVCVCV
jgi:hypothetical protein